MPRAQVGRQKGWGKRSSMRDERKIATRQPTENGSHGDRLTPGTASDWKEHISLLRSGRRRSDISGRLLFRSAREDFGDRFRWSLRERQNADARYEANRAKGTEESSGVLAVAVNLSRVGKCGG